jgi:hypothetical protein
MLASRERIVQTIQARPRPSPGSTGADSAGAARSAGGEPRRLVAPQAPVDIMDLPPAGITGSRSSRGDGPGAIRLVSATEEVDAAPGRTPPTERHDAGPSGRRSADSFSARARYDYDPEYRWLRGRLEYSEIDHQWKLRYIPVDGATDEFGGSVVLSDASQLSGYERGQFVEVRGTLGQAPEEADRGYAPEFEIDQIKRLGT